jgi:hypothetical protein
MGPFFVNVDCVAGSQTALISMMADRGRRLYSGAPCAIAFRSIA